MCWRRAGCEGGLPASCLADRPRTLKGIHGRKGDGGKHDSGTAGPDDVVAVDEAGMSTVEYSIILDYTKLRYRRTIT